MGILDILKPNKVLDERTNLNLEEATTFVQDNLGIKLSGLGFPFNMKNDPERTDVKFQYLRLIEGKDGVVLEIRYTSQARAYAVDGAGHQIGPKPHHGEYRKVIPYKNKN